jgi:hypothetical protein
VTGWNAVREHLPVPDLIAHHRFGGRDAVVFEDVFATGRSAHLLGDAIGLADHGLASAATVARLVTEVCTDLLEAAQRTGSHTPLGTCVPALYLDRLRPGGRLDTWYWPNSSTAIGPATLTIGELARTELVTERVRCRIDIAALIEDTRRSLGVDTCWLTAVTQGDPTEPNIAVPRIWLDFEHAGRNTLAGISTEHRRIEVTTRWSIGTGRSAALDALLAALYGDLGTACAIGRSSVIDALRPFLMCRVLGVIDLRVLDGTDAVLCLAKLAELCQPDLTIRDLLSSVTTSAPLEPEPHSVLAEPRQPDAPVASSPSSQYSTPLDALRC